MTEAVGPPRAVYLKWPLGHPLGEPYNAPQQRTVIFDALSLLLSATEAGAIHSPGYRWRRHQYAEPDWSALAEETM